MSVPCKLVFATNNPHKLEEVRTIADDRFEILSLQEIGCHEEIPETADTLAGNALLKARFVRERYGYDCFADDTGLEIEALGGEPGVYSARYAGNDCNPERNMWKVLEKMAGVTVREAAFRTVIALSLKGEEHLFEGEIRGVITEAKAGSAGFGYDPIFRPEGYDVTFAELGETAKNAISHRSVAVRKLMDFLKA